MMLPLLLLGFWHVAAATLRLLLLRRSSCLGFQPKCHIYHHQTSVICLFDCQKVLSFSIENHTWLASASNFLSVRGLSTCMGGSTILRMKPLGFSLNFSLHAACVASFSGRYGCAKSPKAVPHAVPQAGGCTASRRQPQEKKNRGGGALWASALNLLSVRGLRHVHAACVASFS